VLDALPPVVAPPVLDALPPVVAPLVLDAWTETATPPVLDVGELVAIGEEQPHIPISKPRIFSSINRI
jgi:hypothetical protein